MQYVSINGISSDPFTVNFEVSQRPVLGLLNIEERICAINKTLNKGLREISFWVNANTTALNVAKNKNYSL